MESKVKKIFNSIKSLKIQGAEAVASSAVEALSTQMASSSAKTKNAFLKELSKTILFLKESRPTEPALRNSLRFIFVKTIASKEKEVSKLKKLVEKQAREYFDNSLETKQKIAEYGSELVPQDASVLVHCHSSTVMRALKKAFDKGKNPSVFCTESRPLYQGRLSARELSEYGLKVSLLVDSASRYVLKKMRDTDLVMVGADAITSQGDLVNKVGTSSLALAAFTHEKQFFSCTGTHKFDPLTLWGTPEKIEERSTEEVLSKKEAKKFGISLRKVSVLNPAFDVTEARFVSAYVTELGVIPPASLLSTVWKEFNLDKKMLF